MTFGLGSLLGTYLSGQFLDHYQLAESLGESMHDWQPIWLWPALMSAVTAVVFFTLFSAKADAASRSDPGKP